MIQKIVFKCLSVLTILALLLAFFPAAGTQAAAVDISGTLYGVKENGLHVTITATRTYGSIGADSCQVTILTNGTRSDPFAISGCDSSDSFTVSASDEKSQYSYSQATDVTWIGFTGIVLNVMRTFSGKIERDGGFPLEGYALPIIIGSISQTAPPTDANGLFTFQVPDTKSVTIFPPGTEPAGYRVEGPKNWTASAPLGADFSGLQTFLHGNRNVNGSIDGDGLCKPGATITFTPDGTGLVKTVRADGLGSFNIHGLEPVNYTATVDKTDCSGVYSPPSQSLDLTAGDAELHFTIPHLQITGKVSVDVKDDPTLAYYLVAVVSYMVDGAPFAYQTTIDPFSGSYSFDLPFHSYTLTVYRIGGATLGYDPVSIPINPAPGQRTYYLNFTLHPNRPITGTIAAPDNVAIFPGATIHFASGLDWTVHQPGPVGRTIDIQNAQPKLYYLAPSQQPIKKLISPMRSLVNLTAADSADAGTFNVDLLDVVYDGCIRTINDERVVVPSNGIILYSMFTSRPYYTATINNNDTARCGSGPANQSYHFGYDVPIPMGVYGNLVVDNHVIRTRDPNIHTWDGQEIGDLQVYGDRMISGKLFYAVNMDVRLDTEDMNTVLALRDATTNNPINANRVWDRQTSELQIPYLERKPYKLTFGSSIQGYDLLPNTGIPAPGSPITTDLTSGNVDLGVMYLAQHKLIPAASRAPLDYANMIATSVHFAWQPPELNPADRLNGYQIQVAISGSSFTDSSPTPQVVNAGPTPTFDLNGLVPGGYQWRLRSAYMNNRDYSLWTPLFSFILAGPIPTSPSNNSAILTSPIAPVTFTWSTSSASLPGYKYQVQYSTTSDFSANVTTLTSVDEPARQATTPGTLTTKTQYFWHVRLLNSSSSPVTNWSETWNFWYNLLYPTASSLAYEIYNVTSGAPPAVVTFTFIHFAASQTNPVLPADARYQVQYVLNTLPKPLPTSANTWTFPVMCNACYSLGQLYNVSPGTYKWYMRIVSSADPYNSTGYTAWVVPITAGMVTFTKP